jgi:hypothetical protein
MPAGDAMHNAGVANAAMRAARHHSEIRRSRQSSVLITTSALCMPLTVAMLPDMTVSKLARTKRISGETMRLKNATHCAHVKIPPTQSLPIAWATCACKTCFAEGLSMIQIEHKGPLGRSRIQ